ncbi:MAG TPA: hypothetical protein VE689_06620, partial [Candidatus Udaeobacter sp.]|nr:hypothetical protein [Candidatus Udaeobacter sp.]
MNTMKPILHTSAHLLWLILVLALAVAIPATTTMAAAAAPSTDVKRGEAPDLILYNGNISTLDTNDSTVEAIAIRDGKILATGGNGAIKALAKG